jgi:hypothetical protein
MTPRPNHPSAGGFAPRVAFGLVVALAAAVVAASAVRAGEFQDTLASRWRGAWVVTNAETYSDCAGAYTSNRINGRLVSGRGMLRFKTGELAKVESVDLKRSRLDLRLSYPEPVLRSYTDGPFTLYDETQCRVEMQVELPREMVKSQDVMGVENLLRPVIERHSTEDAARSSKEYNDRHREAYPADYRQTLAQHTAWRAEQTNIAVKGSIDRLVDETSRITERIGGEPDYLSGFVEGVEAGRAPHPVACPDLISLSSATPPGYALPGSPTVAPAARHGEKPGTVSPVSTEAQARRQRGYQDGLRLALGLDAIRRLNGCFVSVPDPVAPSR